MKHFFTLRRITVILAIVDILIGGAVGYLLYASQEQKFGAPVFTVQRSIIPETTATYYLGTSTPSAIRWANIFTTDLNISGTCTGCSSFSYPFPSDATSTLLYFNGGIIVNGASSTIANLSLLTSTTSRATTTDLYVSNTLNVVGTLDVDGLTSALVLTGAGGVFAEYAGTSCTNQFPRSLSALGAATCATVVAGDVDLADLTATDATLTFSGTYDGQTARTIGLNLGNANTWTALQTFTAGLNAQASSTIVRLDSNFSTSTQATSTNLRVSSLGSFANLFIDATGFLQIPHVASTTWGTIGNLQVNDTAATSGVAFYDRTNNTSGVLTIRRQVTYPENAASTTVPLTGTTTLKMWTFKKGSGKLVKISCETHSRTVPMRFATTTIRHVRVVNDTTLYGEYILCTNSRMGGLSATSTVQQGNANSINDDDGSISNGVYPLGGELLLERGNWSGTADDLNVTFIFDEGI